MKPKRMLGVMAALIAVFSQFSCVNNSSKPVTFSIFDVPLDSVESELWFPELMAVYTNKFVNLSSQLCMVGPDKSNLVYFVDAKTGKELGYAGTVGQGPEDMQPYPQYVGKSVNGDTLFLYDYNERKVNAYLVTQTKDGLPKLKLAHKTSLLGKTDVGNMDSSYMNLCRLDNGYYVGLNTYSMSDSFLTLLDKDFNVVKEFGEQPLSGLRTDGKIKNYTGFLGTLTVRGNSIYYAADLFSYMARYDISSTGEVVKMWSNQYATVDYEVYKEWNISFKKSERNLKGFSDVAVGEKYIFATYSGLPTAEIYMRHNSSAVKAQTLVVLNHDGAVLGRFKLNSRSHTIGLSEDEKYLYVMNTDPEVQVVRIKVRDILEKI